MLWWIKLWIGAIFRFSEGAHADWSEPYAAVYPKQDSMAGTNSETTGKGDSGILHRL
jgi:hypothetical protein